MQIQTGPVCFWLLVCIHTLCPSSSPRVVPPERTAAFLPPLITCPQTPSSTLTPHPTSCHFTYITVDQTHISLMETVPSCPRKGRREREAALMLRPLMFLSDLQRHRKYRLRVNLEFQFGFCANSPTTHPTFMKVTGLFLGRYLFNPSLFLEAVCVCVAQHVCVSEVLLQTCLGGFHLLKSVA